MSSIRTVRGRMAAAAIALLALSVAACVEETGPTTDPAPAPAATDEDDPEQGADDVTQDTEGAGDDVTAAAGIEAVEYADCHEYSTAGGASDGVLRVFFGELEVNVPVEVDVRFEDGSTTTLSTLVGADGFATVLVPLSSFGEVIEVTEIRFDGAAQDVSDLGGYPLSYTVAPESDCTYHPENG